MADILEFPTREKQAFSFLQEQLSQLLRRKGADQTLIDFAIASLTDAYGELQTEPDCHFEVRLPSQMTDCLLYTSPSPRDGLLSRMPSSA